MLRAGKLRVVAGDAGSDEHRSQPRPIGPVKAAAKEAESERSGSQKEDPNPDRPVSKGDRRWCCVPGFCALRRIQSFRCIPWAESRRGGDGASRRQGAREREDSEESDESEMSEPHCWAKATSLGPSAAEHSMGAMWPQPGMTSSWDCGIRRCITLRRWGA